MTSLDDCQLMFTVWTKFIKLNKNPEARGVKCTASRCSLVHLCPGQQRSQRDNCVADWLGLPERACLHVSWPGSGSATSRRWWLMPRVLWIVCAWFLAIPWDLQNVRQLRKTYGKRVKHLRNTKQKVVYYLHLWVRLNDHSSNPNRNASPLYKPSQYVLLVRCLLPLLRIVAVPSGCSTCLVPSCHSLHERPDIPSLCTGSSNTLCQKTEFSLQFQNYVYILRVL
jgi:hypothetical protein